MTQKSEQGKLAEEFAEKLLTNNGLKLLQKNYYCRYGEIDLVMNDEKTIVFVEVRFRKSQRFGGALESIDLKKQNKIRTTAQHYLQKYKCRNNARFDVVILSSLSDPQQVNWIKHAFE